MEDYKILAGSALKYVLPYLSKNKAIKQISSEINEAANTSLIDLWDNIKHIFIEEFEENDPDLEEPKIVEREIKKMLESLDEPDLEKFKHLIERLNEDKKSGKLRTSTSSINIINSKNTATGNISNIDGNFQIGDIIKE